MVPVWQMLFSRLLKLIFFQLTCLSIQSKLLEFCERWWQCTQELLAVEEHCEQIHSFQDKQRPWWAFKISGRKIAEGTECDRSLTPAYNRLSKLYAQFDDEVLKCLREISKTIKHQQNAGCQILADGGKPAGGDKSVEDCWYQIHQIHAKCNMLKVCCTPASWCVREVDKQLVGKAIQDSEDEISQQRALCEQTLALPQSGNPERQQPLLTSQLEGQKSNNIDTDAVNGTRNLETVKESARSIDEQPISILQQSTITSDQKQGQQQQQLPIIERPTAQKVSLLDHTAIPFLKHTKTLHEVDLERQGSLCEAYLDCQRNILELSDACAAASGKIRSGKQYDYAPFYRLLEPVDEQDRSCRQQDNGRQVALDIARDQTSGYLRWCTRIQASNALANKLIPRPCFATNTSYYGRLDRLRQQLVQADNCATHVEHFSDICQRLKKCCLPAELCEHSEEFKEATATYVDLMVDLKVFMNRCYHNAITGNLLQNTVFRLRH